MREWEDPFNPFNSIKALVWGHVFEHILAEDYLPPVVVNLDVSGTCNYNCVHCHHRLKQIKDRSLPYLDEQLARTFPAFLKNWAADGHSPQACCIVGSKGDALLFAGLSGLMKDLHFSGIDVGLVTNGYAFTRTNSMMDFAAHYCKFIGFSVDAGDKESYNKIHRPPKGAWMHVLNNISMLVRKVKLHGLRNDIGFKFLILPDSYHTLYKACKIAKQLGVRYVQIRPADLTEEERARIDVDEVNRQIERAMEDLNDPGTFDIVGIRHKFTADFKKKLPAYCYMTALTVTITSDGKCWPCVDQRWREDTLLADCGDGSGWAALREAWGSAKHIRIVHNVINNEGRGPTCAIRCSNYGYAQLFERVFLNDDMDRTLI